MRSILGLAVAAAVMTGGGGALAAAADGSPVATAPADQTDAQIASWLADDDSQPAPSGAAVDAPAPPRQVHGEVSTTLGSRGLRAVSAAADIPVGETGDLGVAVGDARWGGRRGGEARSLSVSLRLDAGGPAEPCGVRHTGQPLPSDVQQRDRCTAAGMVSPQASADGPVTY